MILNLCLFFLVNICSYATTDGLPYKRSRRQNIAGDTLPYGGWSGGSHNPSGGSPGAYYGTGHNPNYGHIKPIQNDAEHSVSVLNYNHPNYNSNPQQQQQQYYLYNNYNSGQRPNNYNYYNQPYNRYPPGSQGWYAAGGNYWFSKGQSIDLHVWLFIISMVVSLICT